MRKYFELIIIGIIFINYLPKCVDSINLNDPDIDDYTFGHTFDTALDEGNRHHMYWSYDHKVVTIRVEALLAQRDDWFAVGFSDDGDISGSDVCVVWTDTTTTQYKLSVNH